MTKYPLCVLALTLAAFGAVSAKVWSDCGSTLASLDAVRISGCDDSLNECILKRNTNVTIEVDLTASDDVEQITTVVHGIMMGMPVPFPLPNPDACKDSGLECPLKAGQKYTYAAVMPVLKAYPKVALEVKWELQRDANEGGDVVCLLIPAKIQ